MKRIRAFLQLSRQDQVLLIRASFVLAGVTLGLTALPWLRLQNVLLTLANRRSCFIPAQRPSEQRIAWAVRVAGRYIPKATCLPQALAAQFLLTQSAYPAEVQIGVARNEDGTVEAHAWVTNESGIISGDVHGLDRFVPLSATVREGIEDYCSETADLMEYSVETQHVASLQRPEAQLLVCCAGTRMTAATADRIVRLLQENIDWRYLLQLALRHNVVPLLYRSLDAVAPTTVPESVRADLKEQMQKSIQGNLFLTKELLHLLALFNQSGILVLPYKGPVLAASVYCDLGLRSCKDLDILVRERDILQAVDVLVSCGYELVRPPSVAQAGKHLQPRRINRLVEKSLWAYQLVLWHPDRHVVVELHWRITPKYVFPYSPTQLWENLRQVTVAGTTVLGFAPENLLWFLCVHGTKHQWSRLSWLCDIAELIRVYPDMQWDQIVAHATTLGIERRLYLGLFLANFLLQAPLPEAIETKIRTTPHVKILAHQVVQRGFDGSEQTGGFPYLERFAFQLRAMDRMADRGRYLLRFANGPDIAATVNRSFLPSFSVLSDLAGRSG